MVLCHNYMILLSPWYRADDKNHCRVNSKCDSPVRCNQHCRNSMHWAGVFPSHSLHSRASLRAHLQWPISHARRPASLAHVQLCSHFMVQAFKFHDYSLQACDLPCMPADQPELGSLIDCVLLLTALLYRALDTSVHVMSR